MTTTVTTTNPVRTDRADAPHSPGAAPDRRTSRGWAFAGLGAGVAGIATIVLSSSIDVVYRSEFETSTDGVGAALADKAALMFAFHTVVVLGAVLMVVFAAGLYRRLHAAMSDSLVPAIAASGLVGTAVVSILGSGLDTEFMMGIPQEDAVLDSNAAMYNHWIGTIPWLWVLAGLAGLALFSAARQGVVPRWIGRVGLVLGGLTVVLGISPLEYMSGVTGVLWLLVTAVGFVVGDRAHRAAAAR
jgi:hypothetical protein